ncbi:hypothetical protein IAT38_005083 [Cryptococcus sp. DSM 104549]
MAYPTDPSTPTDLLSKLPQKFEEARSSGQLFFFPSEAKDVYSEGRRFNLRLCPALQDKAKAKADALAAIRSGPEDKDGSPDKKRPRRDAGDAEPVNKQDESEPFKPPYVPELFVGCLEGLEGEKAMSILLNKYALLPEHMLLCPIEYQPQAIPPTPPQLAIAHNILMAAARHPTRPRKLLAFYNGGEGAGASQKWRHLQFVEVPGGRAPVEDWTQGLNFERSDKAILLDVPYIHIVHPLPPAAALQWPPTPESNEQLIDVLAPALMRVLDLAFDAARRWDGPSNGGWNILMTLDHLHLIPRTLPFFPLPEPHQPLELNSLGYAGMMLVRSAEEEQALTAATEGQGGLMAVLSKCGVPRTFGEQVFEAEVAQHGMGQLA